MSYDKELEEILESIKNDKAKPNTTPIDPIAPPTPKKRSTPKAPNFVIEEISANEPIIIPEPPKPIEKPAPVNTEYEQEEKEQPKSFNLKSILSDKKSRKIFIICAVAVVIAIGVIIGIYQTNIGYVKPYEKEYGIVYPKGIQKQFCDDYGKDRSIRGSLIVSDLDAEHYVVKKNDKKHAYLETGSTVDIDEQFRSIRVSKNDYDLESIYSTTQGFLDSSQQIVFNTLYSKEIYQVIACYYTNTKADSKDKYIFPYNLYGDMTLQSFAEFQDKIESRRLYDTDYQFNYYDHFLSVAVDSDFMDDYVFVVLCARVDGRFKTSNIALKNEKIHYPQSYYDKNKIDNPYHFAPKWYPEIYIDGRANRLTDKSF